MNNSTMIKNDEFWNRSTILSIFKEKNCKDGCYYAIVFHRKRTGVKPIEPFCGYGPKMKLSKDKLTCLTKTANGRPGLRRGC